jgi:proteic killer suppression protein
MAYFFSASLGKLRAIAPRIRSAPGRTRDFNGLGAIGRPLRYVPFDITFQIAVRIGVIKSFGDKRTAAIFAGYAVRGLPLQIQGRARAKLLAVDAAKRLDDLRVPPGNRLEALHGDRQGQHSIRINDQWRLCFEWRDGEAWHVEVADYH